MKQREHIPQWPKEMDDYYAEQLAISAQDAKDDPVKVIDYKLTLKRQLVL